MKNNLLRLVLCSLFLYTGFSTRVQAGCTGVCITLDSTGSVIPSTVDTIGLGNGSVNLYAYYNGACSSLMQNNNVALAWYRNGVPFDTTDASVAVFDGVWTYKTTMPVSQPGLYTVYFLNFTGPSYQCRSVYVTGAANANATGIIPLPLTESDITVFPNPSSDGRFTIQTTADIRFRELRVYNLQGQNMELYAVRSGKNVTTVLLPNAPEGIYMLQLVTMDGRTLSKKILIRHD